MPPEDQGLASHDIEEAHMTLIITGDGVTSWVHDNWHERGGLELDVTFVGATCFCKVDWYFDDVPVPVDDTLSQKAKGVKAPGEPTELEESEQDFEVSSTSSPNGQFVHWRQTWRATNHLFERCECHEWLGTFSCCSFQKSFSACAGRAAALCLGNWKDFRHLASGSRTISQATGPDCDC